MSAEDTTPFLMEPSTPTSRASTQVDDSSSVGDLVVDIEKIAPGKRYHGTRVSESNTLPGKVRQALSSVRIYARERPLHPFLAILTLSAVAILVLSIVQTILAVRKPTEVVAVDGRIPGLEYTSDGRLLTCGDTLEEAERNGCKFDIMTFAWTPPACYDEEMAQGALDDYSELAPYKATGTWPWWRFENHTEPLAQTPDDIQKFDPIFTNNHYHRAHCLYLWRIMHRAGTKKLNGGGEGVYVYEKAVGWEHVIHCNKLLNDMERPVDYLAMAVKVVGHCVRIDI